MSVRFFHPGCNGASFWPWHLTIWTPSTASLLQLLNPFPSWCGLCRPAFATRLSGVFGSCGILKPGAAVPRNVLTLMYCRFARDSRYASFEIKCQKANFISLFIESQGEFFAVHPRPWSGTDRCINLNRPFLGREWKTKGCHPQRCALP